MKRLALLFLVLISPAFAQEQPREVPLTPAQEEVATRVARSLRCVVCQNQSIAESEALLAKEMVSAVRQEIAAGATEDEARAAIVAGYGEFVLLEPRSSLPNALLWAGPFLVLAAGGAAALFFIRGRKGEAPPPPPLSDEERAALERLEG